MPAYLCLRGVLYPQSVVFEGGEIIRTHIDSPELGSIEDVGDTDTREIIFLLHRGSIAQVDPREDLVTVNPVPEKKNKTLL